MMQDDTAGNPIIFYDQCAYCTIDTGGTHQLGCPCRPLDLSGIEAYKYWTDDELKLLMHAHPKINKEGE
jgi:hypothetical protein